MKSQLITYQYDLAGSFETDWLALSYPKVSNERQAICAKSIVVNWQNLTGTAEIFLYGSEDRAYSSLAANFEIAGTDGLDDGYTCLVTFAPNFLKLKAVCQSDVSGTILLSIHY